MLFSIVTVSLNAASGLKKTLDSILSQRCSDGGGFVQIESLVIDGGSCDGTEELLAEYRERFLAAGIPFDAVSEPDNGIYDGMNKGIKRASGDWLYFLNAGDVFYADDVLDRLSRTSLLNKASEDAPDIVYGEVCSVIEDEKGRREYRLLSKEDTKILEHNMIFSHQAAIIKRSFHAGRLYSTEYRLASDYEFFLDAYLDGASFAHVPIVIASFMLDGASNKNRKRLFLEYEKIRRERGLARTGPAGALEHCFGLLRAYTAALVPERLVFRLTQMRLSSR